MTSIARRVAAGLIGAGMGAAILAAAPTAMADPVPPNCTAADLAGISAGVAASTSAYLFTHPEVNAFYTDLEGADRDTIVAAQEEYFETNPQIGAELAGIRAPLVDAQNRCPGSSETWDDLDD
ncbi:heme-binding protein [[Mycobacterium] burgundiense]|jgi:hemophore-related protein|uniref:Heme-binding protein n=1 Tax=[Mycobacterium] burgundiense TaxID=3064286 RepID=A0ABM9LQE2_9MYCO|nr:heme-binding protein [Mycolicibacterium sp. MU0053]CAJ1502921.1 heme-binding protein [Mycolicibacterium sp. MU0053]